MEWYHYVLLISVGIMLLQVGISLIFGDVDLDVDTDFEIGDVVSFKGLLHFVIGFSTTLTTFNRVDVFTLGLAVVVGIAFLLILGWFYGFVHRKLQDSMEYQENIENQPATVYYWDEVAQYGQVFITLEGRQIPVDIASKNGEIITLVPGQIINVTGKRELVHKV